MWRFVRFATKQDQCTCQVGRIRSAIYIFNVVIYVFYVYQGKLHSNFFPL